MELLNRALSKLVSFNSYTIRSILNLIENVHIKFYQILNAQTFLPNYYSSKISSFEQQLKSYSPFTLIIFGLLLIFLVSFLKIVFKNIKKVINFFLNFTENVKILYCQLPSTKAQLEKAKVQIKEEFRKSFKSSKFKKIDFHDNKQDYTKILAKMEQNLSNDNIKANCGKLTGAVYCANDQVKYIAAEGAKMFLYSIFYTQIYIHTLGI